MIFGKRCIFCDKTKQKSDCVYSAAFIGICGDCMEEIDSEKVVRILDAKKPLSMVIPCTYYKSKVRHAIHQFKFENDRAYAKALSFIAENRLAKWRELAEFDAVVPLPVSKERMFERGYNQSLFLSETVSEMFDVEMHSEYLTKVKNVQKQSELKNIERVINISGAYEASQAVKGKNIILVDDIYTSGSTMTEAARMMKAAGAETIVGVVFTAVKRKKYNENIVW